MITREGSQVSGPWPQPGQVVPTHVQPWAPVAPGAISLGGGEGQRQRFPSTPPSPGTP